MSLKSILGAAALTALASTAFAANPDVGGAPMFETKNIVENAVNSADHTTLVAAVKAAGLVDALMGDGPFTVFAPVNDAFAALPAGTVDTLLKPENKDLLTKVLTAHVVAGDLKLADLRAKVGADGYANLQDPVGRRPVGQVQGGHRDDLLGIEEHRHASPSPTSTSRTA